MFDNLFVAYIYQKNVKLFPYFNDEYVAHWFDIVLLKMSSFENFDMTIFIFNNLLSYVIQRPQNTVAIETLNYFVKSNVLHVLWEYILTKKSWIL